MKRPLVCLLLAAIPAFAESGYQAWLRYAPLDTPPPAALPATLVITGDSPVTANARAELIRGVRGMFSRTLRSESTIPRENAVLLGTLNDLRKLAPDLRLDATLPPDSC